jgi:hypothetical protein
MSRAPHETDVDADDPSNVRLLVVTLEDLVAAVEANERRGAGAVLRVTPPFSGRMRARLHLEGSESEYGDPEPIHVPPDRFVEAVPPFPNPDDTEDEIRSDPEVTYTPERHRERHEAAIEAWRRRVREAVVESTSIETDAGTRSVRVTTLGG